VPKNLLKSRDFQEECVLSAIQVLSAHFAQWSYHVSFPEVATIPLFLLKKLHEQTTIESLHRPIKRLIDQVNTQSKIPCLSASLQDLLNIALLLGKDLYPHGIIQNTCHEH
jgi:hypothetical protein